MIFAKRTVLSLILAAGLTPVAYASGVTPPPSALPVITVPKAEPVVAPAGAAALKKLEVSGATLGEVNKPVPMASAAKPVAAKPAAPAPISLSAAAIGPQSESRPLVEAAPTVFTAEPIKVMVNAPSAKNSNRKPIRQVKSPVAEPKSPEMAGVVIEKRGYYDNVRLIPISDRDYNRIVFPEPIVSGRMPAGTRLGEEIVYLSGNRAMMFQLSAGQSKVIQLVAELASGRVETLYLKPQAVPGTVHRVDGAPDSAPLQKKGRASGPVLSQASPHTEAVSILKNFVRGEIPAAFEATEPPVMTRFDKFSVVPAGAWTDEADYKVYVFQLIAAKGQSAVVAPSQFYREGVRAVMVDGDEVSEDSSPYVYIVEDLTHVD